MTLDQRNLPFDGHDRASCSVSSPGAVITHERAAALVEEPPRDQIPGISAMHVAAMDTMDSDEVWVGAGMNQLILRTVGRKSGKEHRVALPYWIDGDGHRVVVASFAGAPKDPAWFLNVAHRDANPEVLV